MRSEADVVSAPQEAVSPLLEVEGLKVHFPVRQGSFGGKKGTVHAVDGVDLTIMPGETLGLVGESGCGKSTTAMAILRRVEPTEGSIRFQGADITHAKGEKLRRLRKDFQMVFQDPYSSLNPRMRVAEIVGEPLQVHGIIKDRSELKRKVEELLGLCGLPADTADRYPHAFSGGQRQRIALARALALNPGLVVADEPTSALDVSIQAQVVNLMKDLQQQLGMSYLFISHNLAIVRNISHRIAIMYGGLIVELAPASDIYDGALHPYTHALLSAVPIPDPEVESHRTRIVLKGDVPNPLSPPPGCRFHGRCQHARNAPIDCSTVVPELRIAKNGHLVACHYAEKIEQERNGQQAVEPGDGRVGDESVGLRPRH